MLAPLVEASPSRVVRPPDKEMHHGRLAAGSVPHAGRVRGVALQVLRYGEFNDPMMGHRIAYSASSQINRKEFGLSFNVMLDGRFVVSDEIQIMIEGELVEQQPAEATSG
jgi:hypothetical protein